MQPPGDDSSSREQLELRCTQAPLESVRQLYLLRCCQFVVTLLVAGGPASQLSREFRDFGTVSEVGPVGLEPTTRGLKVRCSTD